MSVSTLTLPPTAAQVIAASIQGHCSKYECVPQEQFKEEMKLLVFLSISVFALSGKTQQRKLLTLQRKAATPSSIISSTFVILSIKMLHLK